MKVPSPLRETLAAIGLVAALFLVWSFLPGQRQRRAVDAWAHGRDWMKPGEHAAVRDRREQAGLLSVGAAAVPPLIRDLRRPDSWLDRPPALGRPVQPLIRYLQRHRKPTADIRTEAAAALGLLGSCAGEAAPALLDLLDRPIGPGRAPVDGLEVITALVQIGDRSPRCAAAFRRIMASGRAREQLAAAVGLLTLHPDDPAARGVLASLLDPANPGIIANAFTAARMAARVGPKARPAAMPLRLAIIKSYLLWSREALARLAYGLWRADGGPDLALQLLTETTAELGAAAVPDELLRQRLCALAEDLGAIPEFAERARPWVEAIPPEGSLADHRARALSALAPLPPAALTPGGTNPPRGSGSPRRP